MPPITALLQTANDALHLGRALEALLPCAEILIVDHESTDATLQVAREYGARIVPACSEASANHYLDLVRNNWIFCMEPRESISDGLQASLFEWAALPHQSVIDAAAFSVCVRQQVAATWLGSSALEVRLIPRSWNLWGGRLPAPHPAAIALQGELLRFAFP